MPGGAAPGPAAVVPAADLRGGPGRPGDDEHRPVDLRHAGAFPHPRAAPHPPRRQGARAGAGPAQRGAARRHRVLRLHDRRRPPGAGERARRARVRRRLPQPPRGAVGRAQARPGGLGACARPGQRARGAGGHALSRGGGRAVDRSHRRTARHGDVGADPAPDKGRARGVPPRRAAARARHHRAVADRRAGDVRHPVARADGAGHHRHRLRRLAGRGLGRRRRRGLPVRERQPRLPARRLLGRQGAVDLGRAATAHPRGGGDGVGRVARAPESTCATTAC